MNSKKMPKISESEWEVMRVIWGRGSATATHVIEALAATGGSWHPNTVKTLLARLVKKGALAFDPNGRAYEYRPMVSEAECVAEEGKTFLERVFGGALTPMLAHFVERAQLSETEVRELEELLEKKVRNVSKRAKR